MLRFWRWATGAQEREEREEQLRQLKATANALEKSVLELLILVNPNIRNYPR